MSGTAPVHFSNAFSISRLSSEFFNFSTHKVAKTLQDSKSTTSIFHNPFRIMAKLRSEHYEALIHCYNTSPASKATTSPSTFIPPVMKIPISSSGLRDFPVEIRIKIFKEITMHWDDKTPPLLTALRAEVLRGTPESYYEVLELFLKQNTTFTLSQRNGWSFGDMGPRALRSIRNLRID